MKLGVSPARLVERVSAYTDHLAVVAFVALSAVSVAFSTVLGALQLATVGGFVTAGVALYIILPREQNIRIGAVTSYGQHVELKMLVAANAVVVAVAMLALVGGGTTLFRPLSFFILLAVSCGIVAVQILRLSPSPDNGIVAVVLVQIIIITALYKITFFTSGVHSLGGDSTAHMLRALVPYQTGSIEGMPGYSDNPTFHILWASTAAVIGADPITAKYIPLIVSALAAVLFYVFARLLISERASLFCALVLSLFPLMNRVKFQTESVVFPVFFVLILYLTFRMDINRWVGILAGVGFTTLVFMHYYYSLLLLFLVVSVMALNTLLRPPVNRWRNGWTLVGLLAVLWLFRTGIQTAKISWAVLQIVELVGNPSPSTLQVQPSFLSADTSILQFLTLHAAEFALIALSVTAGLFWLREYRYHDGRSYTRLVFLTAAAVFSLLTLVGIFVEGQKRIAWGISFRNAYVIGIFLGILGGEGIARIGRLDRSTVGTVAVVFLLVSSLAFFSMTTQQGNNIDPIYYAGDVPTPRATTTAQMESLDTVYGHMPAESNVLGDLLLTHPAKRDMVTKTPLNTSFFIDPSLSELSSDYEYLLVNPYGRRHGFMLQYASSGYTHNDTRLSNAMATTHRFYDSGVVTAHRSSNVTELS